MMPTGRIKFFNTDKGYGFITPDAPGSDVFIHIKSLLNSNPTISAVNEGDRISYELEPGRDGRPAAGRIKLLARNGK